MVKNVVKTVFLISKIRSNIIGRELFNRTLTFLKRHELSFDDKSLWD
jgi:hypothetical protein